VVFIITCFRAIARPIHFSFRATKTGHIANMHIFIFWNSHGIPFWFTSFTKLEFFLEIILLLSLSIIIVCRSMCFQCEPVQVTHVVGRLLLSLMSLIVLRPGAGYSTSWSAPALRRARLVRGWSVGWWYPCWCWCWCWCCSPRENLCSTRSHD
jgi:hypothetical protein